MREFALRPMGNFLPVLDHLHMKSHYSLHSFQWSKIELLLFVLVAASIQSLHGKLLYIDCAAVLPYLFLEYTPLKNIDIFCVIR